MESPTFLAVGMDPNQLSTLYAKLDNKMLNDREGDPRVMISDNGGQTWTDLGDALPLETPQGRAEDGRRMTATTRRMKEM